MEKLSLAPIFSDGMVLQRDHVLPIWGCAREGEAVTVTLGQAQASCLPEHGAWRCELPPQPAAEQCTLRVCQGEAVIELRNVMIGEVWIAGGQSNMEFFMRYERHWAQAKQLPHDAGIRMYTCQRKAFAEQEPFQSGCGYWFGEADAALETFSAIGYWFARELRALLGVPVGILSCNWGGTSASAWVPEEALRASPLSVYLEDYETAIQGQTAEECLRESRRGWAFQADAAHQAEWSTVMYGLDRAQQLRRMEACAGNPVIPMGPYHKNRPGALFEQMLLPVAGYAARGVLWYQGENDEHHASLYAQLLRALIRSWRNAWHEELPFLVVPLAPFDRWLGLNGDHFPEVRRQQEAAVQETLGCWSTSIMDLGMPYDIHPKEKKEIARRLALLASEKVYGIPTMCAAPELCAALRTAQNIVRLQFRNCTGGLSAVGNLTDLFQVRQQGRPRYMQRYTVQGDTVELMLEDTDDDALEISFAEAPYVCVRLYNEAGLPAKPFFTTVKQHHERMT